MSFFRKSIVTSLFVIFLFSSGGCGGGDDDVSDGNGNGIQSLIRTFSINVPLFALNSAWRQTVTGASVLASSDQQILIIYRVLCGHSSTLSPGTDTPNWPFPDVTYDEYSIPIFEMGSDEESVLMRDYEGNEGGNNPKIPIDADNTVSVPSPEGQVRPSGPEDTDADGHLVLYNPDTDTEYDFWQATTARDSSGDSLGGGQTGDTILEAGTIDTFDTTGPGANPDGYFSARATGPPLLAGLILPEDVESGTIAHALAFSIPGPRNTASDPEEPLSSDYFYPVSTGETDFYNTDPNALASGQRIRLKTSIVDDEGNTIDATDLAPITQMFLAALRTYGAILVDNAGGFTFYAEDIHSAPLNLTDDKVNDLIGEASGTPLPSGKTKWQIVIEKLNEELEIIPFAYGSWTEGQDPSSASITTANYEVITPATKP